MTSPAANALLEGQEEQVKELEERIDAIYYPIVNCPTSILCSRRGFNFGRSVFGLYTFNRGYYNAYDELEYYIGSAFGENESGQKDGQSALSMLEELYGKEEESAGTSISVKKIIGNLLFHDRPEETPSETPATGKE